LKFVCDKCKTRYSIGEERVRGKILKIRCKNCANVITVREGMNPAVDAAAPAVAPAATSSAPAQPEVEWYVSIEGVQSGPMSLADAQRWIASKPFEIELHCWNNGFDDWVSVERVAQFRNLRRPRVPSRGTAPPPLPERPLFASTMASIEKETSGPARAQRPSVPAVSSTRSSAPAPQHPSSPSRTARATGGFAGASQQPEPARAAKAFDYGSVTGTVPALPALEPARPAPVTSVAPDLDDDGGDLAIGEVSRVVKLADLAPKSKAASGTASAPRAGISTGSAARISSPQFRTGSQPRLLRPNELGMNVDPSLAASADAPGAAESMVAQSFRERHRRGMLALIAVSAVLVLGVIGAVIFVVSNKTDEIGGGLGGSTQIDTSRPEDIIRRQVALVEDKTSGKTPTRPRTTSKSHVSNAITQVAEDPRSNSLQASEIEDMAVKQGEGTKRCYMRAQKGAMGFEIADIKKIAVTLNVTKDGAVSNVSLSSHGTTSFGQCLIARIKAWRFRESPNGGTFRISLAFSS
jgi:predicted Zn finger-like uncharacterized protein